MLAPFQMCRPSSCIATLAFALVCAGTLSAQDRPAREQPDPAEPWLKPGDVRALDKIHLLSHSASIYFFDLPIPPTAPLLFLPPDLPVLDTPIPLRSPLDNGVPPPAELAAHVGDLFYPQLASRLAGDELPRRLRVKLEAYRQLKHLLIDELQAGIAAARDLPRESRRATLAENASRQADRLQELEVSAEQLRSELIGSHVESRLPQPEPPPQEHGPATYPNQRSLRTAAFYAEGLSLNQRRLLLSLANELELQGGPAATSTVFFFSPEGAGIRLPAPIDRPVAEALAAYAEARLALGRELLASFERPTDNPSRWRDLAARQAPAFAALENQADAMRIVLQTADGIDGLPPTPPIPPDLALRLAAYRDRKQALLRELNASLANTVRSATTSVPASVAVPVSAFTEEQQAALASLNREKDAIRAALVLQRQTTGSSQDRKSIDNLLEDFERARQAQELREKYADYRTALLEPGLSPAQRRLLLDTAFQHLALPLPSGEPLFAP